MVWAGNTECAKLILFALQRFKMFKEKTIKKENHRNHVCSVIKLSSIITVKL